MIVMAILSMLHEPATDHSALRLFRRTPVLSWTIERLLRSTQVNHRVIFCWHDQAVAVHAAVAGLDVRVIDKGPRQNIPAMGAVAASRRWADGWRGGLLGATEYDQGFHAPSILEAMNAIQASHTLLVDPASGLVDGQLIDRLIDHAQGQPALDLYFTQAPVGLCGLLLRRELIERLQQANTLPGRLLHYMPQQPVPDPIGGNGCCRLPAEIERSLHRFKIDSDRQVQKLTAAMQQLNGQLPVTESQELIARMNRAPARDPMPREVVLELTTRRSTQPIFSPAGKGILDRADLSLEHAAAVLEEISKIPDIRLTLAGVGDPLLHPQVSQIVQVAQKAGVKAISIETDLLEASAPLLQWLGASGVDVISVHMPAVSVGTYQAVMGTEGLLKVLENLKIVLACRQMTSAAMPLVVPLFAKCRQNLAEMEAWYDQWLMALGSAVIFSPETYVGLMPETAVADMAPDRRRSCRRIDNRLMVLCDGTIIPCEMDIMGKMSLGRVGQVRLSDAWNGGIEPMRQAHGALELSQYPACLACKAWHRP